MGRGVFLKALAHVEGLLVNLLFVYQQFRRLADLHPGGWRFLNCWQGKPCASIDDFELRCLVGEALCLQKVGFRVIQGSLVYCVAADSHVEAIYELINIFERKDGLSYLSIEVDLAGMSALSLNFSRDLTNC